MKKRIMILTALVGLVIKIITAIQSKRCKILGKDCGGGGTNSKDLSKNPIIDINKECCSNFHE
tara:strand:- start:585 stop:773 length:189 start_codon:yes stop_codon:yes gene_type:complete